MSITNQLNLWSSDTDSNVISSEGLGLSTQCKTGFQRNDDLPSSIFNGILRETSLVTKSFVNALASLNTTAGITMSVDAMTSVSDLSGAIAAILNGMQTGGGGGTSGTANNLAGGSVGSLPYQAGTSTTTFLAKGSNGYVLRMGANAPYWDNPTNLPVSTTAENAQNLVGGAANQLAYQTAANTTGFVSLPSGIANKWSLVWNGSGITWSDTVKKADTATALAAGEAGAIPYQQNSGTTSFLPQPKSGSTFLNGKLLKSGPNGAPSWELNWTIGTSTFYSGSHSSSSDSNDGMLLKTTGLHVLADGAKLTVTDGVTDTEQQVDQFVIHDVGGTTAYFGNGLTPYGNFAVTMASGKTFSVSGNSSFGQTAISKATLNAANVASMCVTSVPSSTGTKGDLVFVVNGWS